MTNKSTFVDHYAILGVEPTATPDEINKAYRSLVRTHHPDVLASAQLTEEERQKATNTFVSIKEAKEILSAPEKRKAYDIQWTLVNRKRSASSLLDKLTRAKERKAAEAAQKTEASANDNATEPHTETAQEEPRTSTAEDTPEQKEPEEAPAPQTQSEEPSDDTDNSKQPPIPDYYALLGVKNTASQEEIDETLDKIFKRFRLNLENSVHHTGHSSQEDKEKHALINGARETLGVPKSREAYDVLWNQFYGNQQTSSQEASDQKGTHTKTSRTFGRKKNLHRFVEHNREVYASLKNCSPDEAQTGLEKLWNEATFEIIIERPIGISAKKTIGEMLVVGIAASALLARQTDPTTAIVTSIIACAAIEIAARTLPRRIDPREQIVTDDIMTPPDPNAPSRRTITKRANVLLKSELEPIVYKTLSAHEGNLFMARRAFHGAEDEWNLAKKKWDDAQEKWDDAQKKLADAQRSVKKQWITVEKGIDGNQTLSSASSLVKKGFVFSVPHLYDAGRVASMIMLGDTGLIISNRICETLNLGLETSLVPNFACGGLVASIGAKVLYEAETKIIAPMDQKRDRCAYLDEHMTSWIAMNIGLAFVGVSFGMAGYHALGLIPMAASAAMAAAPAAAQTLGALKGALVLPGMALAHTSPRTEMERPSPKTVEAIFKAQP